MTECDLRRDDEIEVIADDGALMIYGNPVVIDAYVRSLRGIAGDAIKVSGANPKRLMDAVAVASTVAASASTAGEYVKLSPESIRKLADYLPMKGDNGYFRGMVMGGDGRVAGQLQFTKLNLQPQQLATIQTAMVMMALRTAIASVEKAVERVEDKVDQVLVLASAERDGDVLGQHEAVARIVRTLETDGVLPTSDWESIVGLGPQLEVTIARLHKHIEKTLKSFVSEAAIQDRSSHMKSVVNQNFLGETFQLLVVAESTMYDWQQLRIARVEQVEPEHRGVVVASARAVMQKHFLRDGELYNATVKHLDEYSVIKPLEISRFLAVASLKRDVAALRADVNDFANARQTQILDWAVRADPTLSDAIDELVDRAVNVGGSVKEISAQVVDFGALGLGAVGSKLQGLAAGRAARRADTVAPEATD